MSATRALFLSGSVGKGHDDVAAALAAGLDPLRVSSETLDTMRFLGRVRSPFIHWVTSKMYVSVPVLYDAFYFSQLRVDNGFGSWASNAMVEATQRRLRHEVERFAPDVVVPVFPPAAPVASRLREDGASFRTVVYVPGSFVDRWWVQETTDLFLVPSHLAAESIRRFWPEARIEVIAPPVRAEYWAAPSQEEARRCLGIPLGAPCVLVVSGSLGHGRPDLLARELADDGYWVIAVGGLNAALVKRLQALRRTHANVLAFGFTDHLPALMSASDVVVTSTGVTCSAARAVGRSLVLMDVVPGHGREDLLHELELGSATVSSTRPSTVRRAVRAFLADPERSKPPPPPEAGLAQRQFVEALRSIGIEC